MSINGNAPKGFQKLAVSTAAVSPTIPKGARVALVIVENDSIRYRDDGTAPTATDGMLLFPGSSLEVGDYEQLRNLQFIQADVASGASQLSISYYHA